MRLNKIFVGLSFHYHSKPLLGDTVWQNTLAFESLINYQGISEKWYLIMPTRLLKLSKTHGTCSRQEEGWTLSCSHILGLDQLTSTRLGLIRKKQYESRGS